MYSGVVTLESRLQVGRTTRKYPQERIWGMEARRDIPSGCILLALAYHA